MTEPFGQTITLEGMARMLALEIAGDLWPASDLRDLYRHQLSSPIAADLRRSGGSDAAALLEIEARSPGEAPLSFGDVLHHPTPSLLVLRAIKDFAKPASQHDGPIPPQIALVLYYSAIVVALLRHGQRITSMDEPTLRRGLQWVVAQDWVDESTRDDCRNGLARLTV